MGTSLEELIVLKSAEEIADGIWQSATCPNVILGTILLTDGYISTGTSESLKLPDTSQYQVLLCLPPFGSTVI